MCIFHHKIAQIINPTWAFTVRSAALLQQLFFISVLSDIWCIIETLFSNITEVMVSTISLSPKLWSTQTQKLVKKTKK